MKLPAEVIKEWIEDNFEYKIYGRDLNINSLYDNDSKFHLGINPELGLFNDYKSGESGTVWKLIEFYYDVGRKEAERIMVENYFRPDLLKKSIKKKEEKPVRRISELPDGIATFNGELNSTGKKAYEYISKRIPKENILKYNLMYAYSGKYKNRIIIPFYENEKIVYFIARDFTGKTKLKYVNPKADKSNIVYNYDKIEKAGRVYIFEGVLDAISLSNGVGTATLGANINEGQISKIISKEIDEVVFVPDNDDAGHRTLFGNIEKLQNLVPFNKKIGIYIYMLDGFKDLNDRFLATGNSRIEDKDLIEYNRINKLRIIHKYGIKE